MSTYVLMRILESAPQRYEIGMRLLTLGRLAGVYDRLTSHIAPGQYVLDLGCGTGALTFRAARRGAKVKGIDINAQMLEIAEQQRQEAKLTATVDLVEMGVAELDSEEAESYDAVTAGLIFSELSEDELVYALKHVVRILRPGGLLLVADEVKPQSLIGRLVQALIRIPLGALTYVIAQQTTHPMSNLRKRLMDAGFTILSTRFSPFTSFCEIVAGKPAAKSL